MDIPKLVEVLRATLQPDQREQAEQQLNEVHKIIGFAPVLLQVVVSDQLDIPVRQAGVIYLKNLVCQFWEEKEPGQTTDAVPFCIHEQDKAALRDNMVEAVISTADPIRVQLGVCISQMVKFDYPGRWPGIAEKVLQYLQSDQYNTWMGALLCLYQLVKNFEYKKPEERQSLNHAMGLLLPLIHQRCIQLMSDQSEASVLLQKQILKVFYALIQYFLPLDLITKEMFTQWMEVCRQIVDRAVPESTLQVDEDDRPELVWWKCKKWAMHILSRSFERYGSPGNTTKDYKQFSEWYLKSFSAGIMQVLFKLLDRYVKKTYIAPRVLQQALNYINQGVGHAFSWKFIKPHVLGVMQDIVFPLMCHSDEDEELWQSDPVEYIKIKYDLFEEIFSPVAAAQTLLSTVVSTRKEVLQKTMGFVMQILTSANLNPRHKAGALHMVGSVAEILLRKKIYKDQAEMWLVTHVFPEFSSQHGYLRARACWMVHQFSEIRFKQANSLEQAVTLTRQALCTDKELPVRVEAAVALQMLLSNQDKAKDVLRPHIRPVIMDLLNVIRETENDDLTSVMQRLVCTYTDEVTPLAVEICTHLAQTFAKVLESDTDGSDEKAITAMGILNTLETICTVMEEQKEILQHIEGVVLDVVGMILTNNVIEFYEEMLSLLYSLTSTVISPRMWLAFHKIYELFQQDNLDYFTDFYEEILSLVYSLTCQSISSTMWNLYPTIYELFKNDGFDYFTEMMPVLHNFITVDPETFLADPKHIEIVFEMCKAVLKGDAGEDAECHAGKLLEVILLQFKGRVDQVVSSFVEMVLERLTREIRTSELRTMCLQVVIAALYYNPPLLISILEKIHLPNSQVSITGQFLQQWLNDANCFFGIHDRKMCVLGLCCLLNMFEGRPAALSDLAQQIFPSLILLFNGLQRAYAAKAEASGEEEEDEEEDDENYEEGELDDEEDQLDDDGQEYLEKLDQNGDDSDEDDEDYDEAEETALESYETLLDKEDCPIDEYDIFKTIVATLEQKEPAFYQLLTAHLDESQRKDIQEVFKLADQRKAANESKKIEERGGYVFEAHQVPNAFNFTTP